MDRLDDRVRGCRQEATNEVRPRDRLGLRAPVTFELRPTPSEGEQRAVFVEGEPDDVFHFRRRVRLGRVFREAVGWNQAAGQSARMAAWLIETKQNCAA